jgi:hypothetical protein
MTTNPAELKIELFRFIDNLSETKLQKFYNLFVLKQKDELPDFWDLLTDWEKDDINAGISDLDTGNYKEINQVLAKYE